MSAKIPPKPSKDTIYVDVDDEITSIIDKVENAEHKVVALVLPKRATSLQSIVNMKLLKRSADGADKNVVLITSEHALLPLAGAAGLHVAKNLQSRPEVPDAPHGHVPAAVAGAAAIAAGDEAEPEGDTNGEDLPDKYDYAKPVGVLAAKHAADSDDAINLDDEDDEKPAKAAASKSSKSKLKVPNFDKFKVGLGLGAAALIGLIIFIILATSVLPKAKVIVNTSSEPVTTDFNLTASTKAQTLDTKEGTIPAKLETTDQTGSQQVTATGQQNNGDKATGSVTLSAGTCGPNFPSDVSSGTGISTNGLSYITQDTASFSAKNSGGHCVFQSNSVNITAVKPGSKYNTSISGASVSSTSYSADGSASGGSDDIVTVLSQSDVDKVKQKLTTGSTGEEFTKDFEKKLTDQGAYVLHATLKVGDAKVTSSPDVGQPASTANVSLKVTYSVLTVSKEDLTKALQTKLIDKIDEKKQKLNDNFFNDAEITVQGQNSTKTAIIHISEDTTVVPIISIATVKAVAKGHKVGDIKSAISGWPGVQSVDVKLSPFWVSKAPGKDSKITVVLKEVKASQPSSGQP
jgi:hypothetical protein